MNNFDCLLQEIHKNAFIKVVQLLDNGVDINEEAEEALISAQSPEMVQLLIDKKAIVDPSGGDTLLHYCQQHLNEHVRVLLHAQSIDLQNSFRHCVGEEQSAFDEAILGLSYKHVQIVQMMLAKGIDPIGNREISYLENVLYEIMYDASSEITCSQDIDSNLYQIAKSLIEYGGGLQNTLIKAAEWGIAPVVNMMIKKKTLNLDYMRDDGDTAIFAATKNHNFVSVSMLCDGGAVDTRRCYHEVKCMWDCDVPECNYFFRDRQKTCQDAISSQFPGPIMHTCGNLGLPKDIIDYVLMPFILYNYTVDKNGDKTSSPKRRRINKI